MSNKTPSKEHLLKKYNLSDDDWKKIVEFKSKEISSNLRSDVESVGQVEALQMQMIDQQAQVISMLMTKINELEAKVNA